MARVKTQEETLKIIYYTGKKWILKNVKAERIYILGIACFIFEEQERDYWDAFTGWNVSHLATGMRCKNGLTRQEAINKTRADLKKYPAYIGKGVKELKKLGFKYPVNI